MSIIKRTIDNSYVIDKNGLPYHVPNEGEFADEWAEINAYAEAHPDEVILEEPYVPTEEEIAELRPHRRRNRGSRETGGNTPVQRRPRSQVPREPRTDRELHRRGVQSTRQSRTLPRLDGGRDIPAGPSHTARRRRLRSRRSGRRNGGSPPAAERRRAARSLSSALDRPHDWRNAHRHAGRPDTLHRRHGRGERQVLQL